MVIMSALLLLLPLLEVTKVNSHKIRPRIVFREVSGTHLQLPLTVL